MSQGFRASFCVPVALALAGLSRWGFAQSLETAPAESAPAAATSSAPPAAIEVRVVGERKQRADRTSDSVRVGGEKLRASPRPTLLEALSQEVPDMYVPARGAAIHGVSSGGTGGIHIRGMGGSPNSQVVVVEDGVPDYQGLFGHPIPDAYVPFLLDDALVVRGGDSVLYGTNAMGGAILLRSRWRRLDGWEVESDASAGSYSTLRQSVAVLGNEGRFGVAGAVHALRSDGHRLGAGGGNLIGQLALRTRLGGGWELTLREKAMHLTGADPGPVTHPNDDHTFDVWRDRVSLQAVWRSGIAQVRVQPFFNIGRHALYDGFLSIDTTSGGILESDLQLHRTVRLLVGSSVDRASGSAENRVSQTSYAVRAQQSASWYEQLTVEPVKGLQLVGGSRLVASANHGFVFLYKGGVRWSFAQGWHLRARAARNFRQPTLHELYLPFPTSNPDLRPERSLGTDLGGGYTGRRFTASGTVYRNDVHDLIKYFGSWPSAEVVNIDHTTVVGVEGQVAVRDVGPFTLRAGGSWQDVGRYTRQNPSARGVFGLDVAQPAGAWTLRASLEGEWVHGLFMNNYRQDPIDDVFVVNLGVRGRRELQERGVVVEPYLLLRNLFDSRYAYVRDYTMPGFHGMAGMKVTL